MKATVYSRSVLGRLVYSTVHTCSAYGAIYIVDRPSTVDFKVRSLAKKKKKCKKSSNFHFFSYKRPADRFRFKLDFFSFLNKKKKNLRLQSAQHLYSKLYSYTYVFSSFYLFIFYVGGWLVYFAACWQAPYNPAPKEKKSYLHSTHTARTILYSTLVVNSRGFLPFRYHFSRIDRIQEIWCHPTIYIRTYYPTIKVFFSQDFIWAIFNLNLYDTRSIFDVSNKLRCCRRCRL